MNSIYNTKTVLGSTLKVTQTTNISMMSHSNGFVASPNGNGPTKVTLSQKNSNMGLTIDTKSLTYPGPPSPLTLDSHGVCPYDAYDLLPLWHTVIRNKFLKNLKWQSAVLANMHVSNHASLVSLLWHDLLVQRLECTCHG